MYHSQYELGPIFLHSPSLSANSSAISATLGLVAAQESKTNNKVKDNILLTSRTTTNNQTFEAEGLESCGEILRGTHI